MYTVDDGRSRILWMKHVEEIMQTVRHLPALTAEEIHERAEACRNSPARKK